MADYPVDRFVLMQWVSEGVLRPAFPPKDAEDPAESYAPFSRRTLREAQRLYAERAIELYRAVLDGGLELEQVGSLEIYEAAIHDDGCIVMMDDDRNERQLERAEIHAAWGMAAPGASPAR